MTDPTNIRGLRDQIDQIDEQILDLLSRRLALSQHIGVQKEQINKPVIDKHREADLNARLQKLCVKQGLEPVFVLKIWRIILQESYRVQNGKK